MKISLTGSSPRRSEREILTPFRRKADSLNRSAKISYENFVVLNIVSSGKNGQSSRLLFCFSYLFQRTVRFTAVFKFLLILYAISNDRYS